MLRWPPQCLHDLPPQVTVPERRPIPFIHCPGPTGAVFLQWDRSMRRVWPRGFPSPCPDGSRPVCLHVGGPPSVRDSNFTEVLQAGSPHTPPPGNSTDTIPVFVRSPLVAVTIIFFSPALPARAAPFSASLPAPAHLLQPLTGDQLAPCGRGAGRLRKSISGSAPASSGGAGKRNS